MEKKKVYKINEFEVLDIIDQAVAYGVNALNGQKSTMSLQIARFWLDGYIEGRKNYITKDDIESLRATMNNYFFI